MVFHSSLTVEKSNKIERIQKRCITLTLGDMFINYPSALEMSGLDTLHARRLKMCLAYSLKFVKREEICVRHGRGNRRVCLQLGDNLS